jgi:hypothetical protein
MPFQIQNILVNEAVEQSTINTDEKFNLLTYTPVWTYNNTSAEVQGNFTVDINGYKVVNVLDSNGLNIKYWLNTLNTFLIASANIPGGISIYITGVDGNTGSNYFIQDLNSIVNNGNNTYTITGG